MSAGPSGNLVFDTGVLVELSSGSAKTRLLRADITSEKMVPHTNELNLLEFQYVVCRRAGWEKALEATNSLRGSGYFRILPASEFCEATARLKCARSLSLADSVTLSVAETLGFPALFARHEAELDREIRKTPFRTKVLFLQD